MHTIIWILLRTNYTIMHKLSSGHNNTINTSIIHLSFSFPPSLLNTSLSLSISIIALPFFLSFPRPFYCMPFPVNINPSPPFFLSFPLPHCMPFPVSINLCISHSSASSLCCAIETEWCNSKERFNVFNLLFRLWSLFVFIIN